MMDPRLISESAAINVPSVSDEETIIMERIEPTGDAIVDAPDSATHLQLPAEGGQPRHARGYWTTLVGALLLLGLIVAVIAATLLNRIPETQYARVTQGNLTLSFQSTGTIQTATYAASFTGTGRVAEIDVAVGQPVTQGDTLAKLDATVLQDNYDAAQAAVTAAQTKLSDAQATQEKVQIQSDATVTAAAGSEQDAERTCNGVETCLTKAENAYAAARATASSQNALAQAGVNDAQSQLATAQSQLKIAQDSLDGATLKAPHTGTIAAINGTVGSTVGGATTAGSFITIADLSALQVQMRIGVGNIGTVTKGNTARFTVPTLGTQPFRGTIATISPLGETTGGHLSYPATVTVDTQSVGQARMLPGMSALVTVTTQQRFNVKLIPVSAVRFAREAGDPKQGGFLTQQQVLTALAQAQQMVTDLRNGNVDYSADALAPAYVLERPKDAWVVKPVVIGLTDGASYEVLRGLAVGDTIVTGEP